MQQKKHQNFGFTPFTPCSLETYSFLYLLYISVKNTFILKLCCKSGENSLYEKNGIYVLWLKLSRLFSPFLDLHFCFKRKKCSKYLRQKFAFKSLICICCLSQNVFEHLCTLAVPKFILTNFGNFLNMSSGI